MTYRRLDPIKEGKRKYRFQLTSMATTPLFGALANHPNCDFLDSRGRVWAHIRSGFMHILAGYAWNGCSPKRYVGGNPPFGKWLGTPDMDGAIIPSLYHDVLWQFAECGQYTLHDANYQFWRMMQRNKFALADVYYQAVERFGGRFYGKDEEGVRAIYL